MKILHKNDIAPVTVEGEGIKGVVIRAMITDKDGAENFALRVFDVAPSGNTPFHAHPWEHEVYILSGGGKVRRENDSVDVAEGMAIFVPADEKHNFVAGEKGLSFICVIPSEQKCCIDK